MIDWKSQNKGPSIWADHRELGQTMSPGGRLGTMPYVMLDSLASNYGHLNALAFSHSYANFKYIFTTSRVPVGRLRTCSNAQVWYENTGFEVHYNAVFPYLQSTSATSAVRSHTSLNFLLSTITCTHVHAKTYASTQKHTHTCFSSSQDARWKNWSIVTRASSWFYFWIWCSPCEHLQATDTAWLLTSTINN